MMTPSASLLRRVPAVAASIAIVLGALPAVAAPKAPVAGALAFGSPPEAVQRVLGKPTGLDDESDLVWRDYAIEGGTLRIAYSRDRVSVFVFTPVKPIDTPKARAWARAFAPGLDRAREEREAPTRWVDFLTFVMGGRPFEAQITFLRQADRVTSLSGEIHWMD